jgi:hypothetical protein
MSSQTVYFTNPSVITGIQKDISNAATTKYIPTGPSRQQSSRQAATSNSATAGPTNQNYLPDTSRFMRDANGVSKYQAFHVEQLENTTAENVHTPISDQNYIYAIIKDINAVELNNDKAFQSSVQIGGDKVFESGNYFYLYKFDKATGKFVSKKNIGDYTGIYTTNYQFFSTLGRDQTRGPMTIYNGNIYLILTSYRYYTLFKIRASDLSLLWYRDVEPEGEGAYINTVLPQWSNYKYQLRQVDVIPPSNGRTNPLVIVSNGHAGGYGRGQTAYIAGLENSQTVINQNKSSLHREFGNITSEGAIYAYNDLGSSSTLRWKFNSMPNNYSAGDNLKQTSFRRDSNGNLIDGIEIMYPLTNGYQFVQGSGAAGIANTAGTFDILTGQYFMNWANEPAAPGYNKQPPIGATTDPLVVAYTIPATGANNGFFDHVWYNIFEGMKAEFAKVTFPAGTTFYNTGSYTGTVQNGPRHGEIVTIPGTAIYSVSPSGPQGQWYHPVPKTLYLQQCATGVNPITLDQYEAFGLSFKGATPYGNYSYDEASDTLMVGFGNSQSAPRQFGLDYWSWAMTQATGGTAEGDFAKANPIFAGWRYLTDKICGFNDLVGTGAALVQDQRAKQARYYGFQDNWRLNTGGYWGGDKYNRALTDSVVGINADNGGLKFALPLNGMDSFAFATSLNGEGTPLNLFYGGGANADAAKGAMVITLPQPSLAAANYNPYDISTYLYNGTGTPGWGSANEKLWARNQTGPVKVLVASTKERIFLYDFDRLVGETSLTHVSGDSTIDFQQGIRTNNFKDYELFYQKEALITIGHAFNGLTWDGNRLITKIPGMGGLSIGKALGSPLVSLLLGKQTSFIFPVANVFEQGLEKHYGYLVDPKFYDTRVNGFSNSPVIYGYKNLYTLLNTVPSTFSGMVEWAFLQEGSKDDDGQKYLQNQPMAVYGNYVITGNENGSIYFINKDTGSLDRELYNEEGTGSGFLINDGIIYNIGGKTKWSAFVNPNAVKGTKLVMYTPYGQ